MDFYITAAPYILIFFGVVIAFIITLKIAIHCREKSLSNKPQDMSRFDIPVDIEEVHEDGKS